MELFLMILKIIGIVLLCILGLILLLILLALFWPFKYVAKIKKDEEFRVKIRVLWLFGILTLVYRYDNSNNILKVKLFGIPIIKRNIAEELNKDASAQDSVKEGSNNAEAEAEHNEETVEGSKTAEESDNQPVFEEELSDEEKAKEDALEHLSFYGKWKYFIQHLMELFGKIREKCYNIKYTFKKMYDKIKEVISLVKYYYKVYKWPGTKRAYDLCKKELGSLLKHIRPVKLKSEFVFGTGDPASTGQIYGYYCMAYPWIGKKVIVRPDFENNVFTNNTYVRGYIFIIVLLRILWKLYFNKDLRKLIRLVKREGKKNGRK